MKGRGLFAWGIVLLALGILLFGAWAVLGRYAKPTTSVMVGGSAFRATVVSTEEAREKGLSGTESLGEGTGMLFVFPKDGAQGIWMKDMMIDLDIVWMDASKTVVKVQTDVSPTSYPKVFGSQRPARYVLEIPAGSASRAGITAGKVATFELADGLVVE